MPIDPPADDSGLTFLWTCARCTDYGITDTWLRASAGLQGHRADQHALYGPEALQERTVPCIDCGAPVDVKRIRQPRCTICQPVHARGTAKARRDAA